MSTARTHAAPNPTPRPSPTATPTLLLLLQRTTPDPPPPAPAPTPTPTFTRSLTPAIARFIMRSTLRFCVVLIYFNVVRGSCSQSEV